MAHESIPIEKEATAVKKALQTIGLTLVIALVSLLAVGLVFTHSLTHADADPNQMLARQLMLHLRDGQTFRLTDAYPEPWDTVQVVSSGETLTNWTWRTLHTFDSRLAELQEGQQLLVFWREGEVARMVRFARDAGMPWFAADASSEEGVIIPRNNALFRATLVQEAGIKYYTCVPENSAVQV